MWFRAVTAALGLLLAAAPVHATVAEDVSREHLVRAAFVYNIAKFVDWPAESASGPDSPVVLCVAGDGALAAAKSSLSDKTIRERPLKIVGANAAEHCHLAYYAESANRPPPAVGGRGTLTVCDPGVAAQPTCMVRLLVIDNRLRFAIDLAATSNANIKISSKLLTLATDVANP
jgi:hypothetical protein